MKIIIGGAGRVGFGIASSLSSEGNDVTVIENDERLVAAVSDELDARAIYGHASDPEILEKAGAADADMIIAATLHDEINMMSCKVAHALFSVPTKIARIRRQSYLQPAWRELFSRDNLPIDLVISPELEVSLAILSWIEHPGAYENVSFADHKYNLGSAACDHTCPVLGTTLRELSDRFPDLLSVVVAILRNDELFAPSGSDVIEANDIVYFVSPPDQVRRTLGLFGRDDQIGGRVIIAGGGNVGFHVAKTLESYGRHVKVRVIESSRERAEKIAEDLDQSMVLYGSVLDRSLLEESDITEADVMLALTDNDQVNFLAAMTAHDMGCRSSLSLLTHPDYHRLMRTYKLGSFVNPRSITISRILEHIRRGRIKGVHPIENGRGEIIEAEALETSPLIGRSLRDLGLEIGIRIGGILRDGKPLVPRGDTRIKANDRIILFALGGRVKKAEQLFRVGIDYFN